MLGACNGTNQLADAQRSRDLELPLQAQRLQNPGMISQLEMGQQPQGGQWVYVPRGYPPGTGSLAGACDSREA